MESFESLYRRVVKASLQGTAQAEFSGGDLSAYDSRQLDCLLHPEKHPPVLRLADCSCPEGEADCEECCSFDAVERDERGNIVISDKSCIGCGECIEKCKHGNLTERRDVLPLFELLHNTSEPVYAMIAPAFTGQFSPDVTPGKLRSAFKQLGFAGMLEVALFADILTLKEALEFDRSIVTDADFLLTSCCCPIWIAMIRKVYNTLVPHIPPSVSPMVACGRTIKKLYPNAKTVFIGPCIAKKAEAKEADIRDAVDIVLTFQETKDIFDIAELDPAKLPDDVKEHSSAAGRIYARTGGVSRAVESTVAKLKPGRTVPFRSVQADGVPACRAMLAAITRGDINANFIEGMGCVGGCVGGPKILIPKEEAAKNVEYYASEAPSDTPADNPYVIELLHHIGFDTIDSLLHGGNLFTRKFDDKPL